MPLVVSGTRTPAVAGEDPAVLRSPQQFLKGAQNISVRLLRGPGVWIGLCAGFGATAVPLLRRFQKDLRLDESTSLSRS
jgi:hypothetical protein